MACIAHESTITTETNLFETSLLQKISLLLQRCHYGKDLAQLLIPQQEFRAHYNNEMVILENYYEVEPSHKGILKGGCWPLSYMLGKKLQADLEISQQYSIASVTGTCPTFFSAPDSTHAFLLLWPKAYDETVRSTLKNNRNEDPKPIPDHCLIVCPSFKVITPSENPEGYTYKILDYFCEDMPELNPEIYKNLAAMPFYPSLDITPLIPLGFLHHLVPLQVIPATMYPNCLILFLFIKSKQQNSPTMELFYVNPDGEPKARYWKNWRQQVASDLILSQWVEKIERDFERADTNVICDQYGEVLKATYYYPFVRR